MITLPSQPSQSGPVLPPKPERFSGAKVPKPKPQPEKTDEPETTSLLPNLPTLPEEATMNIPWENNEDTNRKVEQKTALFAPKLPGFDPSEPGKQDTDNLLDDLLSRMSPFMDVQPVEIKRVMPNTQVATGTAATPPAGSIAGIGLNTAATKPQVIVKWHTGHELWQDAQIDILRGVAKEGPWSPIAINLNNSGEYWWFLTPEDLKPFHVAVRIRSFRGGTQMDVTQSVITIDPASAFTVQSARSP
jgi:hypothetical protein